MQYLKAKTLENNELIRLGAIGLHLMAPLGLDFQPVNTMLPAARRHNV